MVNQYPSFQEGIVTHTTPNRLLSWPVYRAVVRFTAETIERLAPEISVCPNCGREGLPVRIRTHHCEGQRVGSADPFQQNRQVVEGESHSSQRASSQWLRRHKSNRRHSGGVHR
jgi:hypothetical protein